MLTQVDTQDIVKIAKDDGKAIMQVYNQSFDVEYKDTPVLGEVFVPALNVCYRAKKDDGAFKDQQRLPLRIAD